MAKRTVVSSKDGNVQTMNIRMPHDKHQALSNLAFLRGTSINDLLNQGADLVLSQVPDLSDKIQKLREEVATAA